MQQKISEKQNRHSTPETREREREKEREIEREREREGATQIDVHFVTTEQGIQYTFVSPLAESTFRSHECWLKAEGCYREVT